MFTLLSQTQFMKLGEILLRKHLVESSQIKSALIKQQSSSYKIGELLIQQNLISQQDLEEALKEQYWRRNGFWVID